jgi:hypothetical protein
VWVGQRGRRAVHSQSLTRRDRELTGGRAAEHTRGSRRRTDAERRDTSDHALQERMCDRSSDGNVCQRPCIAHTMQFGVATLLLNRGAAVNALDANGSSALFYVQADLVSFGRSSPDVMLDVLRTRLRAAGGRSLPSTSSPFPGPSPPPVSRAPTTPPPSSSGPMDPTSSTQKRSGRPARYA